MSFSFDGAAKTITLSAGTTTLNLAYMYSRYKDWLLLGNAETLPAMSTVGGEIPAIPLYLFLTNGWRIVPQSANHVLSVEGGVLEVEGGGDAFTDPVGSYKIRIKFQSPGIAIGYGGADTWASLIEGTLSAADALRLLLAQAAGDATGLGSATTRFKSLDGSKDRIVGTVSGSTRTISARDGS